MKYIKCALEKNKKFKTGSKAISIFELSKNIWDQKWKIKNGRSKIVSKITNKKTRQMKNIFFNFIRTLVTWWLNSM